MPPQRFAVNSNKNKHEVVLRAPHSPKQHELIFGEGNIVCLAARQFGKTDGCVNRIFVNAIAKPGLYWWCGLSWASASLLRAEGEIYRISSDILVAAGLNPADYINRTKHQVELPNGSRIWLRTAERPDSLAGEGIHGVVADEFTLMNEEVWTTYLSQTLMFYSGWAVFVGVPRGNNWGARLWRQAHSLPGWRALTATTFENPFIPREQIETRRRELPDRMFRQEILAEIIDDAGAVFRDVSLAATALPQDTPVAGHTYIGGVDIARTHDYTVVTIIDVTLNEVCYMSRFNQLGLEFQEERILSACQLFSPSVFVVEETGIGMQMAERLGSRGVNVRAFKTTSNSKDVVLMALAAAIERNESKLKLLPASHPVGLIAINELQSYEGTQGESGNWKYGASSGSFDDCVMSLALTYSGLTGHKPLSFDWSPVSLTQTSVWQR